MQRTEKVIEINAPVERVFDFFSDFESFPRWMRNIKEVRHTGRRYTRWKADAPFGSSVEWEAETTSFEPDHRIAWRSVRGDVYTEGAVDFEETRRGTTRLHVLLGYDPPAGRLGALVAHLFGVDPDQQLEEDLERFAEVVEGGRRRRSTRASYDRGEGAARPRREKRRRGGFRGDFADRDAREDYDARRRDERYAEHRARDYSADDERRREHAASRQRFEEALREARYSQLESRRRYREWQDERRRERDERWRERRRGEVEEDRRLEAERRRRRPPDRHPMTPREWERARETREPDYDYSREVLRRGVDRLMDEPPSGRWRRWD
jgi:uncharacterized protein YndB with AHSA1/START domain